VWSERIIVDRTDIFQLVLKPETQFVNVLQAIRTTECCTFWQLLMKKVSQSTAGQS
jgi:hypothetical protein